MIPILTPETGGSSDQISCSHRVIDNVNKKTNGELLVYSITDILRILLVQTVITSNYISIYHLFLIILLILQSTTDKLSYYCLNIFNILTVISKERDI